jgi:hypothetical protein
MTKSTLPPPVDDVVPFNTLDSASEMIGRAPGYYGAVIAGAADGGTIIHWDGEYVSGATNKKDKGLLDCFLFAECHSVDVQLEAFYALVESGNIETATSWQSFGEGVLSTREEGHYRLRLASDVQDEAPKRIAYYVPETGLFIPIDYQEGEIDPKTTRLTVGIHSIESQVSFFHQHLHNEQMKVEALLPHYLYVVFRDPSEKHSYEMHEYGLFENKAMADHASTLSHKHSLGFVRPTTTEQSMSADTTIERISTITQRRADNVSYQYKVTAEERRLLAEDMCL